ncbi:hypothetical protein [Methylobacterium sp. 22177]|uniref:hypothetical protein n=1 Tax=Methylobacterium sp. 22177 TaxID=3453885 RepID=UPI003F856227
MSMSRRHVRFSSSTDRKQTGRDRVNGRPWSGGLADLVGFEVCDCRQLVSLFGLAPLEPVACGRQAVKALGLEPASAAAAQAPSSAVIQ